MVISWYKVQKKLWFISLYRLIQFPRWRIIKIPEISTSELVGLYIDTQLSSKEINEKVRLCCLIFISVGIESSSHGEPNTLINTFQINEKVRLCCLIFISVDVIH
jgi:hypothetical protein